MPNKVVFIYSGQGFNFRDISQISDFCFPTDLREVYSEVFGHNLTPIDQLTEETYGTNEISTALLLASALHWNEKIPKIPYAVAGYSVGQYLALHAAGVLNRKDLITLVFKRCKAMNMAAKHPRGAMAAILGMRYDDVEKITLDNSVSISNNNAPGNITVAGKQKNIIKVCEIALKNGAYKAQLLNTSGAWHSRLMKPALPDLKNAISQVELRPPQMPVIDNVTGLELDFDNIESKLLSHLISEVKWLESMRFLTGSNVPKFIERTHFDMLIKMGPFIDRKVHWLPVKSCEGL